MTSTMRRRHTTTATQGQRRARVPQEWRRPRVLARLAVVVGLAVPTQAVAHVRAAGQDAATPAARPAPAAALSEPQALRAYGNLPLAFVPNSGRTDPRVRFSAQAGGASFYFTPSEAVFVFTKGEKGLALRLAFLDANPAPQLQGSGPRTGPVSYLIGSDPSRWRRGLPTYGEVVYRDLWPGIDLAFRGERGEIKYEFHVAPGADAGNIRLAYRGADGLSVAPDGDLLVRTALGVMRDSRPLVYQVVDGARVPVASRYDLRGSAYGFALGGYDPARPLIIDPALAYSTLLGGSGFESGADIAVDPEGNAYVTGSSTSSAFPTTAGAFDETHNGGNDVFVTKLNAAGSAVLYSTYIGGSASDGAAAVAIDAEGSAYLTGSTTSTNFPTTPGAYDTTYNGGEDAFVAKLDPSGSVLLYSTYLGGSVTTTFGPGPIDGGADIAVDAGGNAYVTGSTASANFPTTAGAFDTTHAADGSFDAFVTKIAASGAALLYSTFLSGAAGDGASNIAVDADGHAYVVGTTDSPTTFPTTPGAWKTTSGATQNVFASKLNAAGSGLVYSTFLIEGATAHGLAIDAEGNAYGLGHTATGGQATPGAFDTTLAASDAFVAKLNALGSERVYGTYLGGALGEGPGHIAVDAAGNAYVTGSTGSADFPTTGDAFDRTHNGAGDVFLTKLNAAGSALLYSTFLGGAGGESGNALAINTEGDAYVTGGVGSGGFPTTAGAFDGSFGGNSDVFVAKFQLDNCPAIPNDQADTDGDGLGDACDNCAAVVNADQADGDADSIGDACDNCPHLSNPDQADGDGDGRGDACDICPFQANVDQADADDDGVGDACDNCPSAANADQADADADGQGDACDACPIDPANDADGDGVCGNVDNCPAVPNPGQADGDGDGRGDACDACPIDPANDADGDGVCGNVDNCPAVANPGQADSDGDARGDACDACPIDPANDADGDGVCGNVDNCPAVPNPGQADGDGDGLGDTCDACPIDPANDADGDGVCGNVDNCPAVPNPDQADGDGDGVGNACDTFVGYGFRGLLSPYAAPPKRFKGNRTIPLKWQYVGPDGEPADSGGAAPLVTIQGPVPCGETDGGEIIDVSSAGEGGYQYDSDSRAWQFNWKTTGLPSGCYYIRVTSPQALPSPAFPIRLE